MNAIETMHQRGTAPPPEKQVPNRLADNRWKWQLLLSGACVDSISPSTAAKGLPITGPAERIFSAGADQGDWHSNCFANCFPPRGRHGVSSESWFCAGGPSLGRGGVRPPPSPRPDLSVHFFC